MKQEIKDEYEEAPVEENFDEQLDLMVEETEKVLKKKSQEELESMDRFQREDYEKMLNWVPKTELGKQVLKGEVKSIDEILDSGKKILEPEIIDILLSPKTECLDIGQAKGKFGGGKRIPWKQTQKVTTEGKTIVFSALAVAGNMKGYVGIGKGKAKENLPAKEKAVRKSKLAIQKIIRGCGSYDCACNEEHSIPFKVEGKCSSVRVILMPAPQGTGLVAGDQLKKILRLAGIKDVYTKVFGDSQTTPNLAKACMNALDKLKEIKLQ
jgi:small subunit ribosomal protein S5